MKGIKGYYIFTRFPFTAAFNRLHSSKEGQSASPGRTRFILFDCSKIFAVDANKKELLVERAGNKIAPFKNFLLLSDIRMFIFFRPTNLITEAFPDHDHSG